MTTPMETTGVVPAWWFPPAPVEMCRCGRAMYHHGSTRPGTLRRRWTCEQLDEIQARVEFSALPWHKRIRQRAPKGWRDK